MSKKLYFKFGSMGAGKSLDMIRAIYNYKERGMDVLVYKVNTDTRDGNKKCVIKSRTGFEVSGNWIPENESIYAMIAADIIMLGNKDVKAIFIDEAQFLTESQVDELQVLCYNFGVSIICYGLLVDFQRHLFPGSKRLIEIADDKQELIGICHCGKRAKQNARVVNGKMVTEGSIVQIGGSNTDNNKDEIYYVALCNKCYVQQKID